MSMGAIRGAFRGIFSLSVTFDNVYLCMLLNVRREIWKGNKSSNNYSNESTNARINDAGCSEHETRSRRKKKKTRHWSKKENCTN